MAAETGFETMPGAMGGRGGMMGRDTWTVTWAAAITTWAGIARISARGRNIMIPPPEDDGFRNYLGMICR